MTHDIFIQNAHIITLNPQLPRADSLHICEGRIESIGLGLQPPVSSEVVDAGGAFIVPGLTDAHVHLSNFGRFLEELQLKQLTGPKDVIPLIKEKQQSVLSGEWILGRGWDQTGWPDGIFPPSTILDSLSGKHPIVLTRVDGHAMWVNRTALQAAGIDPAGSPPDGGQIINNCILVDNAMDPVMNCIPQSDGRTVKRYIQRGAETFASRGITEIHDVWQTQQEISIIRELIAMDKFPVRCYGMLPYNNTALLQQFFDEGPYISDFYTIRAVKAFADGALGSRGAALLEDYSDDPGNTGLIIVDEAVFADLACRCRDAGFQLCTHAIGDRANRFVLDQYISAVAPDKQHRWRVEHAQMVTDADLPKFTEHGILPSVQPSHCTSDMKWLETRLGAQRTATVSRLNTMVQAGLKIPGGSDCPIEDGIPLWEYYAAVTRQDHRGNPPGGWHSEERLSPLNALRMLTVWAAYGAFAEHRRGQIRDGFDADLTFLDRNILEIPHTEILGTQILATMTAGKFTFRHPSF